MTTNTQLYNNANFISESQKILERSISDTKGIQAVLLATSDGFHICSSVDNKENSERLSAAGSSLLALATSLSSEFGLKKCKSININSETGLVWVSPIEQGSKSLVILIHANTNAILGQVIHSGNGAREAIISLLENI